MGELDGENGRKTHLEVRKWSRSRESLERMSQVFECTQVRSEDGLSSGSF